MFTWKEKLMAAGLVLGWLLTLWHVSEAPWALWEWYKATAQSQPSQLEQLAKTELKAANSLRDETSTGTIVAIAIEHCDRENGCAAYQEAVCGKFDDKGNIVGGGLACSSTSAASVTWTDVHPEAGTCAAIDTQGQIVWTSCQTLSFARGGYSGPGSPEGIITTPVGAIYESTNGLKYIKESGNGKTGWVVYANTGVAGIASEDGWPNAKDCPWDKEKLANVCR